MAYQIDRYNNSLLTVVDDGTIDQTTDLKFIGKNYAGYGEIQNENFLYLLENFAGANQPARPISGQLWFDDANSKLKFFDGTKFRSTGGSEISSDQPTGLSEGDFWWDPQSNQLYVYNGSEYTLVGPQRAGEGLTQMKSVEVTDSNGGPRGIITSTVGDTVVAVISASEFELSSSTPIEGFDRIKKGVTLKWTQLADGGVTNSDQIAERGYRFWGTASNAEKLSGKSASDFVQKNDLSFNSLVNFGDEGINIGNSEDLQLLVENGTEGVVQNVAGQNSTIKFKVTDGSGTLTHVASITADGIIPSQDAQFDLGSNNFKWDRVYATEFQGVASKAATLKVGTAFRNASVSASPDTVAVRDGTGNLSANLFEGTATQARYADLAENYKTDQNYDIGTVVAVGGEHEVTIANKTSVAIGVISEKPAYLMNADADGQAVGLKGRVPIKITGSVTKGDVVYTYNNGCASTERSDSTVGIALETNTDTDVKLVECVLKV